MHNNVQSQICMSMDGSIYARGKLTFTSQFNKWKLCWYCHRGITRNYMSLTISTLLTPQSSISTISVFKDEDRWWQNAITIRKRHPNHFFFKARKCTITGMVTTASLCYYHCPNNTGFRIRVIFSLSFTDDAFADCSHMFTKYLYFKYLLMQIHTWNVYEYQSICYSYRLCTKYPYLTIML